MLRRALASLVVALALIAALPAFAGHDEPVGATQIPGQIVAPGGRISDQSSSCAHGSDSTTITTLYYVPCVSNVLPISTNGTTLTLETIPSSLSLSTANATNFPASTLFDVYAFLNSGSVTLCAVPWQTSTAGSSARGTSAAIATLLGLTVNNATPNCYNGATTYTLVAGEATLLGTFVTTGTAEDVAMQFAPAAAAGGPSGGCTFGYANLYNARAASCLAEDSTSSWTYSTASWGALDGGATGSGLNNRVTWVDPVGAIMVEAMHLNAVKSATINDAPEIGIGVNSTSAVSGVVGVGAQTAGQTTIMALYTGPAPQSAGGLNYVQAVQWMVSSVTATFYGAAIPNGTGQGQGLSFRGSY